MTIRNAEGCMGGVLALMQLLLQDGMIGLYGALKTCLCLVTL